MTAIVTYPLWPDSMGDLIRHDCRRDRIPLRPVVPASVIAFMIAFVADAFGKVQGTTLGEC